MYLGSADVRVYPADYITWSSDKPYFRVPPGYEWRQTGKEGVTQLTTGGEIVNFEWIVAKTDSQVPRKSLAPFAAGTILTGLMLWSVWGR